MGLPSLNRIMLGDFSDASHNLAISEEIKEMFMNKAISYKRADIQYKKKTHQDNLVA